MCFGVLGGRLASRLFDFFLKHPFVAQRGSQYTIQTSFCVYWNVCAIKSDAPYMINQATWESKSQINQSNPWFIAEFWICFFFWREEILVGQGRQSDHQIPMELRLGSYSFWGKQD